MKTLKYFALLLCLLLINSCGSLRPATYSGNTSLIGYKYVYITPTSSLTSSTSSTYGNVYGVYGSGISKSVNPADIISGILIKNGYTILPEIPDDKKDKTLIINYGESGRRNIFLGYAIEVTIQILSANTLEILCSCTAEGMGSTEADDIRIAITRALQTVFPK